MSQIPIPPPDLWNGYDLQSENSFYFPGMYGKSNNAALVGASTRYNETPMRRIGLISFWKKSKNIESRTGDHANGDILIYPELCIVQFQVF
jgi:hypothetical protein